MYRHSYGGMLVLGAELEHQLFGHYTWKRNWEIGQKPISNPKSRNLKLNCPTRRAVLIDASPLRGVQFEISGFWI
jgi:hypothetical protein